MIINRLIRLLLFLNSLVITITASGAGLPFNSNCRSALYQILNFNFKQAEQLLLTEYKENPDNPYIHYLQNYNAFVNIAINEYPSDIEAYRTNFQERIKYYETQTNSSFREKYLLMSEMYLQSAVLYGKFNERFTALKHLFIAEKYLLKYPGYNTSDVQVNKLLPVILLVNSYLPSFIKKLAPINHSPDDAFNLLDKYRRSTAPDTLFRLESDILASFLYQQFKPGNAKVYQDLFTKIKETNYNPFMVLSVSLMGIRMGKQQDALSILNHYMNTVDEAVPYSYFLTGEIKTNIGSNGEYDLRYFLSIYKGQNYLKTAWLKLGWNALLRNDTITYNECLQKVKKTGVKWVEADINSEFEANMKDIPNLKLLKARLLFDGGLYAESAKILTEGETIKSLTTNHQKLEYIYRLARVHHSLSETEIAKRFYNQVVDLGKDFPYYYAANSALQLASIFEIENNSEQAYHYYKTCLQLNKYNYSSSIGAKANEGLRRINRK